MEDFLDEIHLSFTRVADAYAEPKDKETAHLHLIKSHCDGRAEKIFGSLPERQKTKAADLIAVLKSTFNNANEVESREARAHGVMELKQRKER